MAMSYGHVYVASVALGAKDAQTVKAFQEAEQFDGPSLIIANSPCGEHGYDLAHSLEHQILAVETGYWMLYRFDPRLIDQGKPALQLDSKRATKPISEFLKTENRFRQVARKDPARAAKLVAQLETELKHRRKVYEALASVSLEEAEAEDASAAE